MFTEDKFILYAALKNDISCVTSMTLFEENGAVREIT